VVCPVYNADAALLDIAATSVLAEPPVRLVELILVDDGTTNPATRAMLDSLAARDPRVKLLRTAGRQGPGAARNIGIAQARGEWLCFCDADDIWVPGRIELLDEVLALDPAAAWVGASYDNLHPDGSSSPAIYIGGLLPGATPLPGGILRAEGEAVVRAMLTTTELHHCTCCFRADVLRAAGGYGESMTIGEDLLLLLRIATRAPLHCADRQVYRYRRLAVSQMSSPARLREGFAGFYRAAAREAGLGALSRELRWLRYSAEKARALHNLIAGHRGRALRFAIEAWLCDPRELRDLSVFLRLWLGGPAVADRDGAAYSKAARLGRGV
jgi:glycosyltransferase involved in cell wall biosynthesis